MIMSAASSKSLCVDYNQQDNIHGASLACPEKSS